MPWVNFSIAVVKYTGQQKSKKKRTKQIKDTKKMNLKIGRTIPSRVKFHFISSVLYIKFDIMTFWSQRQLDQAVQILKQYYSLL